MKPSFEMLTGRTEAHVAVIPGSSLRLHKDVLAPFTKLQKLARKEGLELEVVSGFRGFEQQLKIWNEKAEGKRALLDERGEPLEFARLSPEQIVSAILRWSALPGASRHHWGTDFDIVAKNLVPDGYRVQLVPSEAAPGGVFEKLGEWLDDNLPAEGFYRPYAVDRGGVSPEWWHLSYAPLAQAFRRAFTIELFRKSVAAAELKLKTHVVAKLGDIFETYIDNVEEP